MYGFHNSSNTCKYSEFIITFKRLYDIPIDGFLLSESLERMVGGKK